LSTAPFPPLRLLSLWLLLAPFLLSAAPWGQLGWLEVAASLGPVALGLDRRVGAVAVGALGFVGLALLWQLDGEGRVLPRLAGAVAVFLVGVALAARAFARQAERLAQVGPGAGGFSAARGLDAFRSALERELARARRHEKGLLILSVACPSREGVDLRAPLSRELRLYAEIAAAKGRVLALVPEVEPQAVETFVKRVRTALEQGLDAPVAVGVARFPHDALGADGLVVAADAARLRAATDLRSGRVP